jgi:hypothetical protein
MSSPTGFHWGTNNYASVLLMGMVFIFFICNRRMALTYSLITGFLLIMSSSRFIFWIYIVLFLALWIVRKSYKELAVNFIGLLLITAGVYYSNSSISRYKAYDCIRLPLVVWSHFTEKKSSIQSEKSTDQVKVSGATQQSQFARAELIKASLRKFKEQTLWGHGLGANNFAADNTKAWSPHNLFMEILVDTGIIGLILYLFIYLKLGILSFKQGKTVFYFFLSSSCAILTTGFVVSSVVYFLPYYLALGLMTVIVTNGYGKELFAVDLK